MNIKTQIPVKFYTTQELHRLEKLKVSGEIAEQTQRIVQYIRMLTPRTREEVNIQYGILAQCENLLSIARNLHNK